MDELSARHITLLDQELKYLTAQVARQAAEIAVMQAERNNALKWGVVTLGGMVLSMTVWIVTLFKDHIKW